MKVLLIAAAAALLGGINVDALAAGDTGGAMPSIAPNQAPAHSASGANGHSGYGHGQSSDQKMYGKQDSAGKTEKKSYSNGMGFDAGAKNMTK